MIAGMIKRRQWNARSPKSAPTRKPTRETRGWTFHYSGSLADWHGNGAAVMRAHQDHHMKPGGLGVPNGGNDIAYNLEFNDRGQIFEGRGFEIQTGANGTSKANDEWFAACFQGTDKTGRDDVGKLGRQAMIKILKADKKLRGRWPLVTGHKDHTNTACPGDEIMSFIALKGWLTEPTTPGFRYPKRAFTFFAWYLGEGPYKKFGPKSKAHYPKHLFPRRIKPVYWAALRHFLRQRKGVN